MKREKDTDDTRKQPLTIGLLVDGVTVSSYVNDLLEWADTRNDLRVDCAIVHGATVTKGIWSKARDILRREGLLRLVSRIAFATITRAERYALDFKSLYRQHSLIHILPGGLPKLVVTPQVSKSGLVYRFSDSDVEKVRDRNLDVLIRCGSGILQGGILDAARFGVLSFHHGDNRINRGGPAGFWESYNALPVTGFVIQQLTEELDGGRIVDRGDVQTQLFYQYNQAHLYIKANEAMKRVLAELAQTGMLKVQESPVSFYAGPLYQTPSLLTLLKYLVRMAWRFGHRFGFAMLGYQAQWGISWIRQDWWRAALWKATSVSNPKGRYFADPFLWEQDGQIFCFVEDYVHDTGRGRITVLEMMESEMVERGVALEEPFHLSFPFIFSYAGEIYMCPETGAAHQIRLYRATEFPLKWELAHVVMDKVRAVDTQFFEHDDKWWMMTSIDESAARDCSNELFLFYADSPLSVDWTPHPLNPVVRSARGGRNGGLLKDKEGWCRVGQMQGYGQYGAGATINRIERLSETEYKETQVGSLTPSFRKKQTGAHHLSAVSGFTVVDHMHRERR